MTLRSRAISAVLGLTVFLAGQPTVAAAGAPAVRIIVTADGPVRGLAGAGVTSYVGIPYAAPPVGPLRWAPPKKPAPWTAVRAATAFGNRCPQLPQLAGFNYAYEFTDTAAPAYLPPTTFPYGAVHTSEVQYLFQLFHGGGRVHQLTPAQTQLSDQMVAYWTAFAWKGVPSTGSQAWPRYSERNEFMMMLGTPRVRLSAGEFARDHHCGVWETALGFPNVF